MKKVLLFMIGLTCSSMNLLGLYEPEGFVELEELVDEPALIVDPVVFELKDEVSGEIKQIYLNVSDDLDEKVIAQLLINEFELDPNLT